ncbi:hypothetical protein [Aureimonas altamirensis]|uniref:hypothetical protein n=1 Tax=Aureimonas altamirensis TaxID=370622 RepID=UPI003015C9BD
MTSDIAKRLFEARGEGIYWIVNSGSKIAAGDRADVLNSAKTKRTVTYAGRSYAASKIMKFLKD